MSVSKYFIILKKWDKPQYNNVRTANNTKPVIKTGTS